MDYLITMLIYAYILEQLDSHGYFETVEIDGYIN